MQSAAVKKEMEQARCRRRPHHRCSRCTSCLNNVIATRSPPANLSTYPTPSGARRGADGGEEGGQQKNRAGALMTSPRPVPSPLPAHLSAPSSNPARLDAY